MTAKSKIEEAVEWYRQNRPLYEALAMSVQFIVQEALKQKKVNFHSVIYRAKDIERFKEKATKGNYSNPKEEIMDMAGIRVITYLGSEARKAADIIRQLFETIPGQSVDKAQELGTDRVGYGSIHVVGKLGQDRLALLENKKFENFCFEIQIRTILQHAWAEFEHDRNYKFKGVLPNEIKRRLSMVAGSLELIDWNFESIAKDIDNYKTEIVKEITQGDLSTNITSASLKVYLGRKLELLIKNGLRPVLYSDEKIINSLSMYEIRTIEQLDNSIPKDFVDVTIKLGYTEAYTSFLIDIMLILNANTYFKKIWGESWQFLSPESIKLLQHYGVPIETYMKKYGIDVVSDEEEFYEQEQPDEEDYYEQEQPDEEDYYEQEQPDEEDYYDQEPSDETP